MELLRWLTVVVLWCWHLVSFVSGNDKRCWYDNRYPSSSRPEKAFPSKGKHTFCSKMSHFLMVFMVHQPSIFKRQHNLLASTKCLFYSLRVVTNSRRYVFTSRSSCCQSSKISFVLPLTCHNALIIVRSSRCAFAMLHHLNLTHVLSICQVTFIRFQTI